jgi:hypothetical protein
MLCSPVVTPRSYGPINIYTQSLQSHIQRLQKSREQLGGELQTSAFRASSFRHAHRAPIKKPARAKLKSCYLCNLVLSFTVPNLKQKIPVNGAECRWDEVAQVLFYIICRNCSKDVKNKKNLPGCVLYHSD